MKSQSQRVYWINRLVSPGEEWRNDIPKAEVDLFLWDDGEGFRPETRAGVAYNDDSLFVYMETDETELRCETKGFGFVHTDSCMEFFLSPDPSRSPQYLNWEFNPAGGMYLSVGTSRRDRVEIPEDNYKDFFQVKTVVHGKGWNLEYRVPLSFLRRFFPRFELKAGHEMRGNFYKCGDKTARPHYGCWNPVDLPKVDFHRPEFFGTLIFC
jgi:hypothetical protein